MDVGSETSCSETLFSPSSVTWDTAGVPGVVTVDVEVDVVNLFLLFCLLKFDLVYMENYYYFNFLTSITKTKNSLKNVFIPFGEVRFWYC